MPDATTDVLRFEVPSPEALERLIQEPLPLGLRAKRGTRSFHREIHFDTSDGLLQARGVSCWFRISLEDRRTLGVSHRSSVGDGSLVEWRDSEADVPEVEPLDALQGSSEPARRLRAVIDPQRLGVRLELEVTRTRRAARTRLLPITMFDLAYDVISVRSGTLTREFYQLCLRRVNPGGPSRKELAEAFRERYGLRPLTSSLVERGEEILSAMEAPAPADGEVAPPQVALLAMDWGRVAVEVSGGALRLPVRVGQGEGAAAELVTEVLEIAPDGLELIGSVATSPGAARTEVWAMVRKGIDREPTGQLAFVPLVRLLDLAGSPLLRDGISLNALALLVRCEQVTGLCESVWPDGTAADATLARVAARLERSGDPGERPEHFLNPEVSTLDFNARVLALVADPAIPPLARLRFLAIFSSNLDEFFMVRVGALRRALTEGQRWGGEDGMEVHEQLDAITIRVRRLLERQRQLLTEECLPALTAGGLRILRWEELSESARAFCTRYYDEQVFPLLTPHAITRAPGHPFPHFANLRLSLALMVRDDASGRLRFGALSLPDVTPRFVRLPDSRDFVPLEDVVRANLINLYPGRQVEAAHAFRVTRSGDIEVDEAGAADLLEAMEAEVQHRPHNAVVRLEVEASMPDMMRDLLQRELRLAVPGRGATPGAAGVFEIEGLLDLSALSEVANTAGRDLDFPPFDARDAIAVGQPMFDVIAERDVLVHHPYDAFDSSVERFLVDAADDPAVQSIRLTLYRAGARSPIVEALMRAAQAGKPVDVFVELKARFDEARNIVWVRKLEQAGAHVVYGLVHLKTHAKVALVARREGGGVRRYVHIGTGNYNASTARLYTDLGLLSANPDLGADVNDLFNHLTGASGPPEGPFRRILVAPTSMRQRFLAMIRREAEHSGAGRPCGIRVKVNGLADREIIQALYRASAAGVPVELVVRGLCTLRPGVPGLSERIRVVSLLGRFLEHARIVHFVNGGADEYYVGSADWRGRNLRRRVEVATPVTAPDARARLDAILTTELADPTAWVLGPDGTYRRAAAAAREEASAQRPRTEYAYPPTPNPQPPTPN